MEFSQVLGQVFDLQLYLFWLGIWGKWNASVILWALRPLGYQMKETCSKGVVKKFKKHMSVSNLGCNKLHRLTLVYQQVGAVGTPVILWLRFFTLLVQTVAKVKWLLEPWMYSCLVPYPIMNDIYMYIYILSLIPKQLYQVLFKRQRFFAAHWTGRGIMARMLCPMTCRLPSQTVTRSFWTWLPKNPFIDSKTIFSSRTSFVNDQLPSIWTCFEEFDIDIHFWPIKKKLWILTQSSNSIIFFPQQRKLMGSSAQISSGVCRCGSQEQVPEEGSREFRCVLL